jgi:hypothetical protein
MTSFLDSRQGGVAELGEDAEQGWASTRLSLYWAKVHCASAHDLISAAGATTTIAEDIRAGLPPDSAPGLEPIAGALAAFRRRELDVAELVAAVDLVGDELELALRARIAQLEKAGRTGLGVMKLRALHASWRWLRRFPIWQPRWVL